jgi:hypothetical protein
MYLDITEIGWGCVDWIDLVQDKDQWRAVVDTIMNLRFHKMLGSSCVASQLASDSVQFGFLGFFYYWIIVCFI